MYVCPTLDFVYFEDSEIEIDDESCNLKLAGWQAYDDNDDML